METSIYNLLRPKTIDEMYPTTKWIDTMKSMDADDLASASYMFEGPMGTGKTTLARALAEKIGATTTYEINAAEARGIEMVREMKESMSTMPVLDNYIVWIIDEVGETTPQFQKALMKEIEDTRENTCIILCTTDPDKVIKQIRDRCIRVVTKGIRKDDHRFIEYLKERIDSILQSVNNGWTSEILNKMKKVLDLENIISNIIENAEGSIRGIINGIYTYALTGEYPKRFDEGKEAMEILRVASSGNMYLTMNNIMKMTPQDAMKVHRAIATYMERKISDNKWKNKRYEFAKAIDKFLMPFEPSMARQVLIDRIIILLDDIKAIKEG